MLSRVEIINKDSVFDSKKIFHWGKEISFKQGSYYILDNDIELKDNFLKDVLYDHVLNDFYKAPPEKLPQSIENVVEVGQRPGVTDNTSHAVEEAFSLFNLPVKAYSGRLYFLEGDLTKEEASEVALSHFANPLINSVKVYSKKEFLDNSRFINLQPPIVHLNTDVEVKTIPLDLSDDSLENLSVKRCLALTLEEMIVIRDYYLKIKGDQDRLDKGLSNWPTDVELEVLAQTWSEHCKHKIFAANIDYCEEVDLSHKKIGPKSIKSLYKSYVKKATKDVESKHNIKWLESVFSDNAGIVSFDNNIDLCIKVETHNSPSALDPYGGAITGILGVNRDILGCGIGALPIANTDVFCFAHPDWPKADNYGALPKGVMPPNRILEGVHKGVEDGGNKSGVPTVNGAFYFDQDFAGKPLVFVGTVGALPKSVNGVKSCSKNTKAGDAIYMVGGKVGADGIHGATFSSMELNENAPATAVQIGDPITQKRVMDFLIEARDKSLYSGITDNGAGGLSSSVGEMATLTGGAVIDLGKCPLKYPGLTPYEIMISESQERMTFSVPQTLIPAFEKLAKDFNVEATNLGEFTNSKYLEVLFNEKCVAYLELDFLHDGLPEMNLKAHFDGERPPTNWSAHPVKQALSTSAESILKKLLSVPTITSKEELVRQYDHEVKGATSLKPFVGVKADGPSDSGVIWLGPYGGEENSGVAIGCGMAPKISHYDTYIMSQYSVDEAIRNIVCVGANPDKICLLDNFCWPDPIKSKKTPDGEYKLAQLVRSCEGLYDTCLGFKTPLVSGKDSMKNDFKGLSRDGDQLSISIPPTLMVTSMGHVDVSKVVSSDFKSAGDSIFLVRQSEPFTKYTMLDKWFELNDSQRLNPNSFDSNAFYECYKRLYECITNKLVSSSHDLSDGGLLVSLTESAIGGKLGFSLSEPLSLIDSFGECAGSFILSVSSAHIEEFLRLMPKANKIGEVLESKECIFTVENTKYCVPLEELEQSFKGGL